MSKSKLFLIDATSFCYRAFYALRNLSTSLGQPTNAIYGFVNILNKILRENKPHSMVACFDVSRQTHKQKKFADYKINRPPMPDTLVSQIPIIKKIISAYGIAIVEKEGYEADDIIATLVKKARESGVSVIVISSDKDILQLVDDNVTVFNPYKDGGMLFDKEVIRQRFGIEPGQICDYLALTGDTADNIPGVPGVGEKTAVRLIREYGCVEGLLRDVASIKEEKTKRSISEHSDLIRFNKELICLQEEVKLDIDLDELKIRQADRRKLFELFKQLEFRKFMENFSVHEDVSENEELKNVEDKDLKGMFKDKEEIVVYCSDNDELFISGAGNFLKLDSWGENVKKLLSRDDIRKIGHDLKRLKHILFARGINLGGMHFDTMLAAYLINPSSGSQTLSDLAWEYMGKSVKKESLEGFSAAVIISKIFPELEAKLREKELLELFYGIEMPLIEVLFQMESAGIRVDGRVLKKLSRELEKRLVELMRSIYELSGVEFNINSPKQLREILFERLRLPVVKRTKTGPSTDEEVLHKLAGKHALPALLLEYRTLNKLKSTYIVPLAEMVNSETQKVHTSFNQTVTETGRLSSSNPNLQNIPVKTDLGKEVRRAVISFSDDSCLLSCDYSQIELRILGALSGDESLISAFNNDADIHKATAASIYGIEEDDVSQEMRDTAKRVNFGITYGLTQFGLSRDLNISLGDAQNIIDAYFVRFPKVREYISEQIQKAQKDGYVATILGRRRYIPQINDSNQNIRQLAQRQAVNMPVQGSASDLIKMAMVNIHSEIKKRGLMTKMILQIHDELLFDVPLDEFEESVVMIKNIMEHILELGVPIRVDIKKGKNWLEMCDVDL